MLFTDELCFAEYFILMLKLIFSATPKLHYRFIIWKVGIQFHKYLSNKWTCSRLVLWGKLLQLVETLEYVALSTKFEENQSRNLAGVVTRQTEKDIETNCFTDITLLD